MSVNSDFRDLLFELNAADAHYLVVGGYAVAFHAQPRFTKDFDLWLEPTPANAGRVLLALGRFGAPLSLFSEAELATPGLVFQLGVAPSRIDLITAIDGVAWEEAWPGRARGRFGDVPMWVIGLDELIRNKRVAGRPSDLADVVVLETARSPSR